MSKPKFKKGDRVKAMCLGEEYIFTIEDVVNGLRGYCYYSSIGIYRESELTLVGLTPQIFIARIADMYDTGDSVSLIVKYIRENISEVKEI